jgi:hypothetical protein
MSTHELQTSSGQAIAFGLHSDPSGFVPSEGSCYAEMPTAVMATADPLCASYPQGIRYVDLASVVDSALIPGAVTSALESASVSDDPLRSVVGRLKGGRGWSCSRTASTQSKLPRSSQTLPEAFRKRACPRRQASSRPGFWSDFDGMPPRSEARHELDP